MSNYLQALATSRKNINGNLFANLPGSMPVLLTRFTWFLFFLSVGHLGVFLFGSSKNIISEIFIYDGLTFIVWVAVTFFSGIVHSYSLRYMAGYRRLNRFMLDCSVFTWAVMFMTAANNIVLYVCSWFFMGILMSKLIGHIPGWEDAKTSGKNALAYFTLSTLCLGAAAIALFIDTGKTDILSIASATNTLSPGFTMIAAAFIIVAAIIQSGLYPFQGWLLSSMTAPTPASALMHAGFVNAAGILLTRFSPLLFKAEVMWIIVLAGGIAGLLGELWKLVQTNYKRKLACSTIGQMGFMILQCGLGFFTAAIAHLILHGFYKAYLFLSSGSLIEYKLPEKEFSHKYGLWEILVIAVSALIGGGVFSILSGKGLELNSGLLLIFVVVITVIQMTLEILKHTTVSRFLRILCIPLILLPSIAVYAFFLNFISIAMKDMPFVQNPTQISFVHLLIVVLYVVAYLGITNKWFVKSKRLYVYLVNVSQPKSGHILNFKK